MQTGSSEDAYRPLLGTTWSYQAISTIQTLQACTRNSTKEENFFFICSLMPRSLHPRHHHQKARYASALVILLAMGRPGFPLPLHPGPPLVS